MTGIPRIPGPLTGAPEPLPTPLAVCLLSVAVPLRAFLLTALLSMVPVVELRGGIPFGVSMGLSYPAAIAAAVIGNMLPVPFIIVYIRRIFQWMRRKSPKFEGLVSRLEERGRRKGRLIHRYQLIGLYILVSIPLPGTGAWTGALAAAMLDIRLRRAVPVIFLGVLTAAVVMSFVTWEGAHLFL